MLAQIQSLDASIYMHRQEAAAYVRGLTTSAASTVAGPTSQSKKMGVMRALNSQAKREVPGKRARKSWVKPWLLVDQVDGRMRWCFGAQKDGL